MSGGKNYDFIDMMSNEHELYAGVNHPDNVAADGRSPSLDTGSNPVDAADLIDRGSAPSGSLGQTIRRHTRWLAGRLIQLAGGDFQMSTRNGSLVTDGRKLRVRKLIATATFEGYLVQPNDHVIKVDQSDRDALRFVICLPNLEYEGAAAGIPAQLDSYTAYGSAAQNVRNREFWGRELYIEAYDVGQGGSIEIRQGRNFSHPNYKWFQSAAAPNEWYLALATGADPSITNPSTHAFYRNDDLVAYDGGGPGTLNAGTYGFGDNDTLGFNTIYIYVGTGANPNFQRFFAGYGLVFNLDAASEVVHLVAYWDETSDAGWDILSHFRHSGLATTAAPTTAAPTTNIVTTEPPTTEAPTTAG